MFKLFACFAQKVALVAVGKSVTTADRVVSFGTFARAFVAALFRFTAVGSAAFFFFQQIKQNTVDTAGGDGKAEYGQNCATKLHLYL